MISKVIKFIICLILFVTGIVLFTPGWCSRGSDDWFKGDPQLQEGLSKGVEEWIHMDLTEEALNPENQLSGGEWVFAAYMMAGMGFGQTAMEHPERRSKNIKLMDECISRLLSPGVRKFDRDVWLSDPIEDIGSSKDHAGYLGYLNLLLSLRGFLEPEGEYADLNNRITQHLSNRVAAYRHKLLYTYPREIYPVDNCAVIASISLYDKFTGGSHSGLIEDWVQQFIKNCLDMKTGLIYQSLSSVTLEPADYPRGSGTALGSYFLSFMDRSISLLLYKAVREELSRSFIGFGMVREYPRSIKGKTGDADSGPVVFGIGVTPTLFSIGISRIHQDKEYFSDLYGLVYLIGAPHTKDGKLNFIMAGPLGDPVLFAMLTAQKDIKFSE